MYTSMTRTMTRAIRGIAVLICIPFGCLTAQSHNRTDSSVRRPTLAQTTAHDRANPNAPFDTTMQLGRNDLTRYATPGICLVAVHAMEGAFRRLIPDTAPYTPARDTANQATVAFARRCGSRFTDATLPSVPPRELLNLMRLALLGNNDTFAHLVAEHYLKQQKSPDVQGRALVEIDSAYLTARPIRLAAAETVATRLDALGPGVAYARARVHDLISRYAAYTANVDIAEREAGRRWAVESLLTERDRSDGNFSPSITQALNLFGLYLISMSPADALVRVEQRMKEAGYPRPTELRDAIQRFPSLREIVQAHAQFGLPVPSLSASYWFVEPGAQSASGGARFPVPGKISLYLYNYEENEFHDVDAIIQRMRRKYGDKLAIVYMMNTQGYFHNSPPLSAAEEAERLRKYVQDDLKLSVTLAVDTLGVQQQRLSDGRIIRLRGTAPYLQSSFYRWGFLLVDPAGRMAAIQDFGGHEAVLDAMIGRLITADAGGKR